VPATTTDGVITGDGIIAATTVEDTGTINTKSQLSSLALARLDRVQSPEPETCIRSKW
jgi:hypothetical protein